MKKQSVKKTLWRYVLLVVLLFGGAPALAQQHNNARQANKEPDWIKMMDDPNVNFFVIDKSFNDYWKGKELPVEEDEILDVKNNSERKRGFLGLFKRKESAEKKEEGQKYAFEYKKYQWWRRQVLPYVQSDGTILNKDQQIQIWQKQKELKTNINAKEARERKEKEKDTSGSQQRY
ncbi:hypothetical protein CLV51_103318 [Chitinophaga niastensis]|uniref:GLPGLI family protein n=1 Tax=Chitinophaga niastensis TaxID=536980 RepID=A0A2P8HJJ3_CHINA|nr:hypothetical protein [Chitinophaga niastensis]PSL46340.1 hypothetical protein CLV51_103318 [Chitinophaga niastensis]